MKRQGQIQAPETLHVKVERYSRFGYSVTLVDPARSWYDYDQRWHVWGRERAERLAQRKLRKALRYQGYEQEKAIIFREER